VAGVSRRLFIARGGTLLAGFSGLAAAACGSGGQSGQPSGGAAPAVSGTMTWFMRANTAEMQWEQAAVGAFKQAQPGVTVNLETVATSADFDPKLTALVAGGTPPDVWTHWGQSGFGDYYVKGLLGELSTLLARDKVDQGAFLANANDAWNKDGKLYGLSFNTRFATFTYFNKQLFQQAGITPPPVDWADRSWTWDKMVEAARKLTTGAGSSAVYGFAAGAQPRTWGMAYLFGGDFFVKEHYDKGIAKQSNIGSPEVLAAMSAEADLITKLHVWPSDADRSALGSPAPSATKMFTQGQLAMMFDTGSEWPTVAKDATFEWGVAAAPRQKDDKVITFVNPLMLAKESKSKETAWAFIKWQVSEPGQRLLVQHAFQPVRKDLLDAWLENMKSAQPKADVRKCIETAAPHAQIGPNQVMAEFGPVRTAVDEALKPAWDGQKSAADALRDAKQRVDVILAETYARYAK
jgi:multiple sugar transport system substrate-binding protein